MKGDQSMATGASEAIDPGMGNRSEPWACSGQPDLRNS
jgi:hypothetical protein